MYPYTDELQTTYNDFIATLNTDLDKLDRNKETKSLYLRMRKAAWIAAIRYAAISLTDRELNVLNRINNQALKFTNHAKEMEFNVLTATNKYASFTAQHCTGGLDFQEQSTRVSFVYRIEREAKGEIPMIVSGDPGGFTDDAYNPLREMEVIQQAMFYINEYDAPNIKNIYNKLFYGRS